MEDTPKSEPLLNDVADVQMSEKPSALPAPLALWYRARFITLALGIFLMVAGAVGLGIKDPLVHSYVNHYTSIYGPGAPLYQAWLSPANVDVTTLRQYHFYNVTNPEAVLDGARPNLVEVGPFAYDEVTEKDPASVRWYSNGSVGYTYTTHLYYNAEASVDDITGRALPEDTPLVVLNPALKGILYRIGKMPDGPVVDWGACEIVNGSVGTAAVHPKGLFVRRTVKELLWGYDDPLWVALHPAVKLLGYTASTRYMTQWNGSVIVPSPYTYRSGQQCPLWMHLDACNNSGRLLTLEDSGVTDVSIPAGQETEVPGSWLPLPGHLDGRHEPGVTWGAHRKPHNHGDISTFAGQRSVWWWGPRIDGLTQGSAPHWGNAHVKGPVPGDRCRKIYGSAGVRFPPQLTPSSRPALFLDMLGLAANLSFTEHTTQKGIPALRFSLDAGFWDSNEITRECFSMRFSGMLNVSGIAFGPGTVSKPLFLDSCFLQGDTAADGSRMCRAAGHPDAALPPPGTNDNAGFEADAVVFNVTFSAPGARRDPPSPVMTLDEYAAYRHFGGIRGAAFREAYDSYVEVEPLTGATVRGHATGQVNLYLGQDTISGCDTATFFPWTRRVPRTVIPFLRFSRRAALTGAWLGKLQSRLAMLLGLEVMLWGFLALGAVSLAATAAVWVYVARKHRAAPVVDVEEVEAREH